MPRKPKSDTVAAALITARASAVLPAPEVGQLSESESSIYAGLLNEMPADQRNRTSTRLMAAELARATVECAELADQIKSEGRIIRHPNGITAAHPAIAIRTQAASRIVALIAKLGLAADASGDKAERNSRAQAEQSIRGPLRLAATKTDAPAPDWSQLLKAEAK
jgi:hypothetical protein